MRPAAGSARRAAAGLGRLPFSVTPVGAVIVAATLLALGLRGFQIFRTGHLLGVGDYDDGADFGSALRLIHGVLPYRDFIIVQPPGIVLLMVPAAALSPLIGTAGSIAVARILTVAASAAAVVLGGLLVRHRGVFATLVTCGVIAIYPGSVQAAHTVMLEPWLTVFCLAGAVAVFDRDRLTGSGRRLAWGGAALGFAGAVKVWAIIPAAVIVVACLLGAEPVRRATRFVAGVAAGFLIPVLPFAILAPGRFYDSVIVAQLIRTDARTPLGYRLQYLTGLAAWDLGTVTFLIVAVGLAVLVAGTLIAACRVTHRGPPPLEWFSVATAALIVVAFLVPDDFYYHYPAFLAPFLAMAFALPAARLLDGWQARPGRSARRAAWLRRSAAAAAGLPCSCCRSPRAGPRAAPRRPTPAPCPPWTGSSRPGPACCPTRPRCSYRRTGSCPPRRTARSWWTGSAPVTRWLTARARSPRAGYRPWRRCGGRRSGPRATCCSPRTTPTGSPGRPSSGPTSGPTLPGHREVGPAAALRAEGDGQPLTGWAAGRCAPGRCSALSERPDHQPGPRLGAERGGLAGDALAAGGDGIDVPGRHRGADDRGPAGLVGLGNRLGGVVVDDPDVWLAVADPPDPRDQQLLQDRGGEGAPERRAAGRHGRVDLDRVGVGEQADLAAARDQERRAVAARLRELVQGGGQ